MSNSLTDKKGYPIRGGDIIKVFHFATRTRKYWMYKIVSHDGLTDQWWAHDIRELFQRGEENGHKCPLQCCVEDGCEIIDGTDKKHGFLPTYWHERKKE